MRNWKAVFEIDRAIAYVILGRSWTLLAGFLTLWLIARYLTPAEQGFYYAFANILGLQVFLELGLSYVIMQTASHEMAHLNWNSEKNCFEGDFMAKARLSALFRQSSKIYCILGGLFLIMIIPIGSVVFFSVKDGATVIWLPPWIVLSFLAAITLVISPIGALLEGCGFITEILKYRLINGIAANLFTWGLFMNGGKLFSAAGALLMPLVISAIWLWKTKRLGLLDLWKSNSPQIKIKWRTEIWPFQWKIAVSWLSNYVSFQLLVPFFMITHGAALAGKLGMSLQASSALSSLAMAWVSTKAPVWGRLVAEKRWNELNSNFSRMFFQNIGVMTLGSLAGGILLWILQLNHVAFGLRFLIIPAFTLLLALAILQQIVFSFSVYFRAYKTEPLLYLSIFVAGIIVCSLLVFGESYGVIGFLFSCLLIYVFFIVPIAYRIFVRFKKVHCI